MVKRLIPTRFGKPFRGKEGKSYRWAYDQYGRKKIQVHYVSAYFKKRPKKGQIRQWAWKWV